MQPKFEPTDDGLEIIDPIERHRYRLTTHEPVSPEAIDTSQIPYPVDRAVEITTEVISLPTNNHILIRDESGSMMTEAQPPEPTLLPVSKYILEISAPLKLYMVVESSITILFNSKKTSIYMDEGATLLIGARSYHTRPANTITTTSEPSDLMQVVSAFGSALKTTSPERSYPTLRGHPPLVEIGSELNIPEGVSTPSTGIKLEIPQELKYIFAVSPLAYYLGAKVIPGPNPRLTTANGFSYSLDTNAAFEDMVDKTLKRIFLLDCIVRTEGITPLPLYEREIIEPYLPFDITDVYNMDIADRVAKYLEISFDAIDDHLPDWKLNVTLNNSCEYAEFLPFVTNKLAKVKTQERENDTPKELSSDQTQAIEDFTRSGLKGNNILLRGSSQLSDESPGPSSIEQSWYSTTSTEISSTAPITAFYNSIEQKPKEGPIDINVICNDSAMREELESVNGVYGTHKDLPFDVSVHYNTTISQLSEILAEDSDFLHYIGHIDDRGFYCTDGWLDAMDVAVIGPKAFFLNACQSHEQGLNLIDSGSIGGIVTFGEVVNSGAIDIGRNIAQLLNHGFPLYAALDIVRKHTIVGGQYHIVGDGTTTISQSKTRTPTVCLINSCREELNVDIILYEGTSTGKGSLVTPHLESVDTYYLLPGRAMGITTSQSQLKEFFDLAETPVIVDGELTWGNNVFDKFL